MDLSTAIQFLTGLAIVVGLGLNLRKTRSDESLSLHAALRADYDRVVLERNDLRAQNIELAKTHESADAEYILQLEEQVRERDTVIRVRDVEIARLKGLA